MTQPQHWIYLSTHFDDVVLCCGGIIWEQVQAGNTVEIWTVCAGASLEPDAASSAEMKQRHEQAIAKVNLRRLEDIAACRRVGAVHRHLEIPDAIYRKYPGTDKFIILETNDLWQELLPVESYLVDETAALLERILPQGVRLAAPVAIGDHMDHHMVRSVAERVALTRTNGILYYYADFPYTRDHGEVLKAWIQAHPRGRKSFRYSADALKAWDEAIAFYPSQVIGFWRDRSAHFEELVQYSRSLSGHTLWRVRL